MKRITAFILIILYLGTSTGATMHFHYCMGERAGSSIWGGNEKNCGNCGMENEEGATSGCCKDEIHWIKLDDDQKASSTVIEIPRCLTEHYDIPDLTLIATCSVLRPALPESTSPLRSPQSPAYLLNCIFRI